MDDGGKGYAKCRMCPNKCFWQKHTNVPYFFELCTEQEERISDELLGKYKTAFQKMKYKLL